jgi:hypothetical protein
MKPFPSPVYADASAKFSESTRHFTLAIAAHRSRRPSRHAAIPVTGRRGGAVVSIAWASGVVIQKLNPILNGWCTYFRAGNSNPTGVSFTLAGVWVRAVSYAAS